MMMSKFCPNYNTCRLVNTNFVIRDDEARKEQVSKWCTEEEIWKKCKRYQTRRALWMCPDFVLPDSEMTEEEIIERHEKESGK
jgi:hypothetical protein